MNALTVSKMGAKGIVQDYSTVYNECHLEWFSKIVKSLNIDYEGAQSSEVLFFPSFDMLNIHPMGVSAMDYVFHLF